MFNIIDGFNVNAANPIDTRIVVPTISARNAIQYKYNGLTVFVTHPSNRRTYVYNSTTLDWDIPFNGTASYMAVINDTANGITASIIMHNTNGITFKHNNPIITADGKITLKGGSGNYIALVGGDSAGPLPYLSGGSVYVYGAQDLYGTSPGNLYLGFNVELSGPMSGYVIVGQQPTADVDTQFLVNMPTQFDHLVRLKSLSEINADLIFNNTLPYSTSISSAYIKSNSMYSTSSTPDYTWFGDTKTGVYHPAANTFGVSVNGGISMLATSTSTNIAINGATGLSLLSNKSILMFGGSTVSISATAIGFNVAGSVPFNAYTIPDKIKITTNDVYANVHQQGLNGIGDSGNIPMTTSGPGVPSNGPWNYPSISSGIRTGLVASNLLNVSLVVVFDTCWSRVGNIITVSGLITFTVTNANNDASFRLNLPINSYFNDRGYTLSGIGKIIQGAGGLNTGGGDVASISSYGTNAYFQFRPTSIGPKSMTYNYQYITGGFLLLGGGGSSA